MNHRKKLGAYGYMVECRVSRLGITIMIWGSKDPLGTANA